MAEQADGRVTPTKTSSQFTYATYVSRGSTRKEEAVGGKQTTFGNTSAWSVSKTTCRPCSCCFFEKLNHLSVNPRINYCFV